MLPLVFAAQPLFGTDLELSVEPDVAEIGQQVRIDIQISPAPPAGEVFHGIEILIYQPDGFSTRHGPFDSFPNGSVCFHYTPIMNGIYIIHVTFPEQALANNAVVYAGITKTANLTVPPIPPPPSHESVGVWKRAVGMAFARGGLGVAVANGKIYAIGGSTDGPYHFLSPYVFDVNEEYDPASGVWATKRAMPTARTYFGVAVCQGRIYCISGMSREGPTGVNEAYDPAADSWETRAPLPEDAWAHVDFGQFSASAAVLNDRVHVVTSVGAHYVYCPLTDTWMRRAPLPIGAFERLYNALVVLDGKLYAVSNGFLHVYEAENDSWRQAASPPDTWYVAAAAVTGKFAPKQIVAFALPQMLPPFLIGDPYPCVTYVYFPHNDSWVRCATAPSGRFSPGIAVVDDVLYVVGGFVQLQGRTVAPSSVVERFLPPGYGTVPPRIRVLSPENETYAVGAVQLVFTVDRPVVWMACRLNSGARRPVDGNVTLAGLGEGAYALTVYATDAFGNTAASETVHFTVANPAKAAILQAIAIIVPVLAVVIVAAAIIKRYKRRKPKNAFSCAR
ncbi:MAG: hypothetical protein QXP44_04905 [Candidatus Bathyarchaeia archaeon]